MYMYLMLRKGSRAQFPAGGLGVTFFATGPGLGLKMSIFLTLEFTLLKKNLSVDNECKC